MIKMSAFSLCHKRFWARTKEWPGGRGLFNTVKQFNKESAIYFVTASKEERLCSFDGFHSCGVRSYGEQLVPYRYENSRYPRPGSVLSLRMPEYTDVADKALSGSKLASGR